MRQSPRPYSVPRDLGEDLEALQAYWRGLERGQAAMPFTDDLKLDQLSGIADRLILLEVFDSPHRFRFGIVGREITARDGVELEGKFVDEVALGGPLDYLASQCAATIEGRAPTYYRNPSASEGGKPGERGYRRLLLPMWGEGHISLLLGAVDWTGEP